MDHTLTEKKRLSLRLDGCGGYGEDVESQIGGVAGQMDVHFVSMSIPACLAWHVLSFLLGILTTVLVIWGVPGWTGRGGVFFTLLGP